MLKALINRIYPYYPSPTLKHLPVQHAIIEALTARLHRLGHPVTSVHVPSSTLDSDGYRYDTAAGVFDLVRGLDAFGNNVSNDNTASATVAADAIATKYVVERTGDVEPVLSALRKFNVAAEGGSPALTEEEFRALARVRVVNESRPATVPALSDDDLVRLIGATIAAKITKQTGHRDNWDAVDRDEDGQVTWVHPMSGVEPQIVARAVLAKLRTHGVIR